MEKKLRECVDWKNLREREKRLFDCVNCVNLPCFLRKHVNLPFHPNWCKFPWFFNISPTFSEHFPENRVCVNFEKKLRECVNFENFLRECGNFGSAGGGLLNTNPHAKLHFLKLSRSLEKPVKVFRPYFTPWTIFTPIFQILNFFFIFCIVNNLSTIVENFKEKYSHAQKLLPKM